MNKIAAFKVEHHLSPVMQELKQSLGAQRSIKASIERMFIDQSTPASSLTPPKSFSTALRNVKIFLRSHDFSALRGKEKTRCIRHLKDNLSALTASRKKDNKTKRFLLDRVFAEDAVDSKLLKQLYDVYKFSSHATALRLLRSHITAPSAKDSEAVNIEEMTSSLPPKILKALSEALHSSQKYPSIEKARKAIAEDPKVLLDVISDDGDDLLEQFSKVFDRISMYTLDAAFIQHAQKNEDKPIDFSYVSERSLRHINFSGFEARPLEEKTEFLAAAHSKMHTLARTYKKVTKSPSPSTACETTGYDASIERIIEDMKDDASTEPLTVTMLGVEFSGLLKEGGLAEALEGLTKGVKTLNPENKVRLVFPKYSSLPQSVKNACTDENKKVCHTEKGKSFNVYRIEQDGIEVFLVEDESFVLDAENPSIYGPDEDTQKKRFSTFTSLAHDFLSENKIDNEILHLHDWHVSGLALKLRKQEKKDPSLKRTPIVFTFHNNSRSAQGRVGIGAYNYTPVFKGLREIGILQEGENPFIKTLEAADMVTTVSENFAKEVQTEEFGEGISFALRKTAKAGRLLGIVNGTNVDRWNPETDKTLTEWKDLATGAPLDLSFSPDSDIMAQKQKAKEQIYIWTKKYFPHTSFDPSKPLMTYIGRYDSHQKGLEHFAEAAKEVLEAGGQFICMGSQEDSKAQDILNQLEQKYGHSVLIIRDYKDSSGKYHYQQGSEEDGVVGIGSVVRAATDFMFIPSVYEPCGLVQGEGFIRGAKTIGSHTGGLVDTVIEDGKGVNGYLFHRTKPGSLPSTIKKALTEWEETSHKEKNGNAKRIMENARLESWTSSPRGLSPTQRYHTAYKVAQNHSRHVTVETEKTYDIQERIWQHALRDNGAAKNQRQVKQEELYLEEFYHSPRGSEALHKNFSAFPSSLRQRVPSPYGRGVDMKKHLKYGALPTKEGTSFAVEALKAEKVELILFNEDGTEEKYPLVKGENSQWQGFFPGIKPGQHYQYCIDGARKIDPYGRSHTTRGNENEDLSSVEDIPHSIVCKDKDYSWDDATWMQKRKDKDDIAKEKMSIYEVHPSSFKKHKDGTLLTYRELAVELVNRCDEYSFSHVELMGILDHPSRRSLGYQITGFFAPDSRMGTPEDFKYLIDTLHKNDIGVILDWVPAHFATDEYALKDFDGNAHFEGSSWKRIFSKQNFYMWGTHFFDYSNKEVRDFLISNAYFWMKEMHIDAFRVDAVSCIRNSSTKDGELFLKDFNAVIHEHGEGVVTIAEDYSNYSKATHSYHAKGLGFDMKWNVGWVHSVIDFFSLSTQKRKNRYDNLVHTIESSASSNTVLAFSHDEAKASWAALMQGSSLGKGKSRWEHMRSIMGLQAFSPGKKMMFMGTEVAYDKMWTDQIYAEQGMFTVDAEESNDEAQLRAYIKDTHDLYHTNKAFSEKGEQNFEFIQKKDPKKSLIAYRRKAPSGESCVCLHNFSSTESRTFELPIPKNTSSEYGLKDIFNSDNKKYGGQGRVSIEKVCDESGSTIKYKVTLPPLANVVLEESGRVKATKRKNADIIGLKNYIVPHEGIRRIVHIALKIFKAIKAAICFPSRYIGSKSWSLPGVAARIPYALYLIFFRISRDKSISEVLFGSGYHRKAKKVLTPDQTKHYLQYAAAAAAVHNSDASWIKPCGYNVISPEELSIDGDLPGSLKAHKNCFYDAKSGLKVMLATKGNKLLVSFGALASERSEQTSPKEGSATHLKTLTNAVGNLVGISPGAYTQAEEFVSLLRKSPAYRNKRIELTGQCYGGSIASFVALRKKLKAICLNTLPIGAGLQHKIGRKRMQDADKYITHINAKGDYTEGYILTTIFDFLLSSVGIKTFGKFGVKYDVPSAYKGLEGTHHYILGSMMKHCGNTTRTKPHEIADQLRNIE
jgi:1,4-alpha-glucan branching enzyme